MLYNMDVQVHNTHKNTSSSELHGGSLRHRKGATASYAGKACGSRRSSPSLKMVTLLRISPSHLMAAAMEAADSVLDL